MNYGCSVAIGAASGLRSMLGPAIVSEAATRKLVPLRRRSPVSWMASAPAARTSEILAAAELIADKLPFTPNRTVPSSLMLRGLSGALCGMAVVNSRRRSNLFLGAILGGAAAIGATWLGFEYRKRVKMPKLAAALVEDAVAIGIGGAVVRAMCR